jgi:sigma-B regulation protein RsbU (phosphoserine phosphatase)
MTTGTPHTDPEPRIGTTLMDDIRQGGFVDNIRREFSELRDFMLSDERKERLKEMHRVKRWLAVVWWLLKSMFLKLTPTRRILFVLALIATFNATMDGDKTHFTLELQFSALILLFILMLELKDKLVAHRELEAGHAVQEALMPERSPAVPGWRLWLFTRSANEVGGDLVDFIRIGGERCGVALGDVEGKGLRAALLTAKLQAILRATVPDFSSLAAFGKKLNQIFYRDRLPNMFASIVYLEIRPGDGQVRLMNAGHFLPLIIRRGGVQSIEKGGPALGILPEAEYTEQLAELQPGETILIYTDGLTEARNDAGEFFSETRLLNLLPSLSKFQAAELGERLVGEVDRFLAGARPNDDLSIAILERV